MLNDQNLQQKLVSRNDFLSMASHELKNPIQSLKLQTQIVKRRIDAYGVEALSQQTIKKLVNNFHHDINRMSRLVEDLLDISRINSGQLAMEYEYLNFDEFMEDLVNRLSQNFPRFNELVKIQYNVPLIVHIDRLRMEQVITNLVSNSLKFGNNSPIDIMTSFNESQVIVKVKDHGLGMNAETQEKILQKFEHGPQYRDSNGLGLGLYICYEIVKAHNGILSFNSIAGHGTVFRVMIPFKKA